MKTIYTPAIYDYTLLRNLALMPQHKTQRPDRMSADRKTITPSTTFLAYSAFAFSVNSHAGYLFSLKLSSITYSSLYFCSFNEKLQGSSRLSPPPLLNIPSFLRGQMHFHGFNYCLCMENSEMFLYGMLKMKGISRLSYAYEKGSLKL
jgi:hypothetical protein